MSDDPKNPDNQGQGDIVVPADPGSAQKEVPNETPTDERARLQRQQESRIEPDNEDG